MDYGGKYHNTVGHIYPPSEKVDFQKNYKFSIAFENTYCSGYTMEKLVDSFASQHIPLYYGNPRVAEEFNPKAFINAHDFNSLDFLYIYLLTRIFQRRTILIKEFYHNLKGDRYAEINGKRRKEKR